MSDNDDADKCETCKKVPCMCKKEIRKTTLTQFSTLKPPDLLKSKDELPMYERKLLRWSRKCGIPIEDQGDLIFLHPSETNPSLQERLDGELGDKMDNNPKGIQLIIDTLKSWFGADKGVDLIRVFNEFVITTRNPSQDFHSYVATFEEKYNKLQKFGEEFSSRLLALFLLKNANLTDTEFQIITSNLDFSSEKDEKNSELYQKTKDALNRHQNCQMINAGGKVNEEKTMLLNSKDLDLLTKEEQEKIVLWAKKKQKQDGNNTEGAPPFKKWRKCKYCLCDCEPKYKRCDCPCSQHPHWKCPKKESRNKEEEAAA